MKKAVIQRAAAAVVAAVATLVSVSAGAETNETSILFIGNSLVFVNDLPAVLAKLAQAGGQKQLACARETPGGCTFEKHWKDGKALKAIQSRRWDFVVLQENSGMPEKNRASMFEYGRKLNEAITNQGSKAVLYMTWSWPGPDAQPLITAAYQELAKELDARLAPVGSAWGAVLKNHPGIGLFSKDNHHPSPAGTYLAACVFYAVLYGRSPEGLPCTVKDLGEADARILQKEAFEAARAGFSQRTARESDRGAK